MRALREWTWNAIRFRATGISWFTTLCINRGDTFIYWYCLAWRWYHLLTVFPAVSALEYIIEIYTKLGKILRQHSRSQILLNKPRGKGVVKTYKNLSSWKREWGKKFWQGNTIRWPALPENEIAPCNTVGKGMTPTPPTSVRRTSKILIRKRVSRGS